MNEQRIILPSSNRESAINRLVRFLSALPEGKPWALSVKQVKRQRSDPQNNALWGVAYKVLHEETGNDPENLHEYFCGEHFGWVEFEVMGKRKLKPRRTTTTDENGKRDVLPWDQFGDFYAFIQRRAAETVGVYVPDPDPEYLEREHREV